MSQQAVENKSMEVALEDLAKSIAQWTDKGDQFITAVPGLSLFRRDEPTQPMSGLYEPSICLIARGAKRVLLGDDTYVYDAHHFLITSVHLPTVVQIIRAPYLGLMFKLDRQEISQLMVDSNLPLPPAQQSSRGMAIGEVTLPLLTAFKRLIDLLSETQDIPILAPIIQREITYVCSWAIRVRVFARLPRREAGVNRYFRRQWRRCAPMCRGTWREQSVAACNHLLTAWC